MSMRTVSFLLATLGAASLVVSSVIQVRFTQAYANGQQQVAEYQQSIADLEQQPPNDTSPERPEAALHASNSEYAAELAQLKNERKSLSAEIDALEAEHERRRQTQSAIQTYARNAESLFHALPSNTLKRGEDREDELAKEDRNFPQRRSTARKLVSAVNAYARAHEGSFPKDLAAALPYLSDPLKREAVNDFDLVYQGNSDELENIPMGAVALLREREPWLTPEGRQARIYVMAGHNLEIVETDGDFSHWEANHIIPAADPNP